MLVELVVENLAVVEQVRVRFHPGLNLLTGETGSGKSIVVDALGLLFGGRASADMIRSGAQKARVSAIFDVARELPPLKDAGIECEDGELLIEREIQASGKSRAFVGSRPVTAALLRELAPFLGDIHGQHEQQNLASTDAQRDMLDTFAAGSEGLLAEVAGLYREWRRIGAELDELERTEAEKLRLTDLWSFQRKEIEAVELKPREDEQLEGERKIQKNVARLEESATAAYALLYEDQASAAAQLRVAMRRIEDLARIDESFAAMVESLRPASIAIDDASHTLRDYLGRLQADPQRLEAIETRMAAIEKLKRKYGTTIDEILAFLESVRKQLNAVATAGERRAQLEKDRERAKTAFKVAAAKLTAIRKDAGRKLAKKVQGELASLAMAQAVFEVRVNEAEWSSHGADAIEFLISANVGEEPKPLDKVASGGELSRVALALKTCTMVAKGASTVARTLVFDEVDAGIGGGAADAVGRKLKKLAGVEQVLCVTHLAQVASYADHHYFVDKRSERGRTYTTIDELDRAARTREIGRMLSGERLTPEALKHAEQMIKAGVGG
ncbi:MAG TPA: DNA repair protein RecN [Bryobacteraceae bacterium]|jgi:DNA repair protein RecN (Recombination protein N)